MFKGMTGQMMKTLDKIVEKYTEIRHDE